MIHLVVVFGAILAIQIALVGNVEMTGQGSSVEQSSFAGMTRVLPQVFDSARQDDRVGSFIWLRRVESNRSDRHPREFADTLHNAH